MKHLRGASRKRNIMLCSQRNCNSVKSTSCADLSWILINWHHYWGTSLTNLRGQHNPANYLDDEEDMSYEALLALGDRIGNVKQNKSDNATIQSLPTRKCPTSDMSCAVCLDDFKKNQNQRGLPCDHWFHLKCINKWLKNSTWCPICRKSVQ